MVYIDGPTQCVPTSRYRWPLVSHLFADTSEELHAFAASIGLKRQWADQKSRLLHYDLCPSKRLEALFKGAIPLDRDQAVKKHRELRS